MPANSARAAVEEGEAFRMYIVEQGDNLESIASRFQISPRTLVVNNFELLAEDFSQPGRQIIVLATDGVLHTIKSGEDLSFVGDLYSVAPEQIVNYAPNGLTSATDVAEGRVVVVPGGQPPIPPELPEEQGPLLEEEIAPETDGRAGETPGTADTPADEPPTEQPTEEAPPVEEPAVEEAPVDSGAVAGWTWPVSGCGITRGVSSDHHGIDIGLFCNPGATIVAAAAGTVVFAGWDGGYGNSVVVDHGNGLFSRYAHLSSISVSSGTSVGAGGALGISGNTGNSSGEHLHFEIRADSPYGAVLDPMSYLP
ncbi:MAG: peptidoglycan DD-metalloendopeptidase family protein [Dehalococcoidia bacterium]|nr:peptidoglycan DD-metalloendopeptidase family protein [Dehalococcoidia bacterium]